jgi:hypothetical protein
MLMRWNSFSGTLVFAALAAVGLPAAVLVLGPGLGAQTAVSLYVVASACLYLVGCAPRRRWGLAAAIPAAGAGAVILLVAPRPEQAAVLSALMIAVCRSGLLYRSRPGRALLAELLLTGIGLAVAHLLWGPGLLSAALALWGYYLVQSVFFLIGGVQARRPSPEDDPFELARSRLLALLGE